MDDFIEGGSEVHLAHMKIFYDKYNCGKIVDLVEAGPSGTLFAGRRVVQQRDFTTTISMDEYVRDKMGPIEVPK